MYPGVSRGRGGGGGGGAGEGGEDISLSEIPGDKHDSFPITISGTSESMGQWKP